MKNFWHRFSVAGLTIGETAVSLVYNRRHSASSDYHLLSSKLIHFMMNNGDMNNVFLLCELAERYGEAIAINPNMDMPAFLNCYYIALDADIGCIVSAKLLGFIHKTDPLALMKLEKKKGGVPIHSLKLVLYYLLLTGNLKHLPFLG